MTQIAVKPILPTVPSPFSASGNGGLPSLSSGAPVNPLFNTTKPLSLTPAPKPAIPNIAVNTPTIQLPSPIAGAPGKTVADPLFASAPAPATPAVPAPAKSSMVTTPSGKVVNASTGSIVSPYAPYTGTPLQPGQVNIGTAGAPNVIGPGGTPAPIAPVATGTPTGTPTLPSVTAGVNNSNGFDTTTGQPIVPSPLNNPLYTSPAYEAAVKAYQSDSQLTPAEIQAQQDLNNLQLSARTAITNTKNQPIPLEFQTGQQRNLTEMATNLQLPLQQQLALAQAQRTQKTAADEFAANAEANKISGYRDFNKPTSVAIGSTLVNPATGTSVFGGGQSDILGKAIADGRLTPDMVTRYGQTAILSALQLDPGYNFVTQKASVAADSSSLKDAQSYVDTTSRAYSTATANLGTLNSFMSQYGINQSGVPLINQLQNKVKAGLTDPGAIAAFQTALTGLRAEYAQVLARGGQVTDTSRNEANSLIPDNLSPEQLAIVTTQLNTEGANAIKEANQKVSDIKARVGGNSGSSSNTSGGGVVQTSVGAISTDW